MSPDQIALVQRSFRELVPSKDLVAKTFYDRLFELDPGLKPLFRTSPHEQGQKLMTALAALIGGLAEWRTVEPVVRELGMRHSGYGVRPEHYDTFGAALLWTLEQRLGEAFTDRMKSAWSAAYASIAATMIDATKQVA